MTSSRFLATLVSNVVPNAPALGARSNFDALVNADFTWTHSDDDGDAQVQRQIQIRRTSDLVVVVDSTSSTSSQLYTVTGGTLANGINYEWRVRTADAEGFGAWSGYQPFSTSAAPVVTITNPVTNGAVVNTNSLDATWTSNDPITAYRVRLNDGGPDLVDTGKVAGNVTHYLIEGILQNGGSYTLTVYVWDDKDVSSAATVRTFTVTYTPPAQPLVALTTQGHFIRLTIDNPTPVGAEPLVTSNSIYRRKSGETSYVRIKTAVANDGVFDDYAVASGQTYEYVVTGIGNNGTSRDSNMDAGSVTLKGAWIHDPVDPAGTSMQLLFTRPARTEKKSQDHALVQYAGRPAPVAQFGEADSSTVGVTAELMRDSTDMAALDALRSRKAVVCYRDGRAPLGRKVFGIIPDRDDDDAEWGSAASLEVKAVDYSEVV